MLGERGAIDRNEGCCAAVAFSVKSPCNDSLAGSSFTRDQNGDVGVGYALDDISDRAHGGDLANQIGGRESLFERLSQRFSFVAQLVLV
jgi:hypothetical protein